MEIDIIIGVCVILLFVAAFVFTRQERQLSEERMSRKFYKSESEILSNEVKILKGSIEYYKRELQDAEVKYRTLRDRFDELVKKYESLKEKA